MRQPLAIFLLFLEAGCAPTAASKPNDAIEVLVASAPTTLDPRYATDAVAMRISRLLHAGLVRLDPTTLAPLPCAASSWQWDDERTLSVALRNDVHFAPSGAPLEARDVCATLQALVDPGIGSPHRAVAASIGQCEPLDEHHVRLRLREPRATLLTDLEVPILRHNEALRPPNPKGNLEGLGAYTLAAWNPDAVVLKARAGGAYSQPHHDVTVRVVHDENARAIRLLAGRADVVPNGISAALLPPLEHHGLRISSRPGANLTYLLIHNERAPLSDPRARHALAEAIDRDMLVHTLLGDRARVAQSLLPPESWAFTKGPTFSYVPEHARQLAHEAGLEHVLLYTSTERARSTLARAIAQMLGDSGIRTEVVSLELGVLLQRLTAGDYEVAILQIPELTEPNVLQWFFHSGFIPSRDQGGVGANRARYRNKQVDHWLDLASQEIYQDKRASYYAYALTQMAEDLPVIPLFHEDEVAVLSPRAQLFQLSAEGRWGGLVELR